MINIQQIAHPNSSISVVSPNKRLISPNADANGEHIKLLKKTDNSETENAHHFNNFDIGFYFNCLLTNIEIEEVLKKNWKPKPTFEFPNTVIISGKYKQSKNLKF